MSIDVKLYQASQHCERAARRARELLYQPGGPVASEPEAVRNCILAIEQVRELNPTDNPGFHEAALRRIVAAYPPTSCIRPCGTSASTQTRAAGALGPGRCANRLPT